MLHVDDMYDELFTEDIEQSLQHLNKKLSSGKKRLKVRRKIEDLREKKRLKRQLDYYGIDY